MDKACEQNRFRNKLDGKPDMVSPSSCAACLNIQMVIA